MAWRDGIVQGTFELSFLQYSIFITFPTICSAVTPYTMAFTYRPLLPPFRALARPQSRLLSTTPARRSTDTNKWDGRHGDEHVLNRDDELDIQSGASKSGKRERVEEDHPSSATTEKDTGNNNEQAKKDHPEAPGPVIGMNSERGGVSSLMSIVYPGMC